LVLALGLPAHPKNARDLTFQPFSGNMDTVQSICFLLSGGGILTKGRALARIWKFVRFPGVEADGFSQASFADKASW
jgi:hypothetical protein